MPASLSGFRSKFTSLAFMESIFFNIIGMNVRLLYLKAVLIQLIFL